MGTEFEGTVMFEPKHHPDLKVDYAKVLYFLSNNVSASKVQGFIANYNYAIDSIEADPFVSSPIQHHPMFKLIDQFEYIRHLPVSKDSFYSVYNLPNVKTKYNHLLTLMTLNGYQEDKIKQLQYREATKNA